MNNFMLPFDWSLDQLLSGAYNKMLNWVGYIILIIGVILLGIAIFQLLKKFGSGGQGGMSWVLIIIMACVGGALMGGGIKFVYDLTKGAQSTITNMGNAGEDDKNKNGGAGALQTIILDDGSESDSFTLSDGTTVVIPK
jgi:hypothetical protein